jgi:hypothetical protein
MSVGLIESQNPRADADMPAGCNPSDAVSGSGDPEDKKARKSRRTNKRKLMP